MPARALGFKSSLRHRYKTDKREQGGTATPAPNRYATGTQDHGEGTAGNPAARPRNGAVGTTAGEALAGRKGKGGRHRSRPIRPFVRNFESHAPFAYCSGKLGHQVGTVDLEDCQLAVSPTQSVAFGRGLGPMGATMPPRKSAPEPSSRAVSQLWDDAGA